MDARKEKILRAIIKEYLLEAEPVSSKTIVNRYGLNVSSATIRNEMAALEELGYISQPHISSGRVPAPSGYRYYVDHLMEKDEEVEDVQLTELSLENRQDMQKYLRDVAALLAGVTNYTVVVTEERIEENTIKHLKLVGLMEDKGLLILVLSSSKVKDYVLPLLEKISDADLQKVAGILEKHLRNRSADELDEALKQELKRLFPDSPLLVEEIIRMAEKALLEEKDIQVVVEGMKNIFKLPEFREVQQIQSFLDTMEDEQRILAMLDGVLGQKAPGIEVRIGEETGLPELRDFTVIATTCSFCEGLKGKIGIIGPTRMFYEKNIRLLEQILRYEEVEDGRAGKRKDQA